MYFFAKMLKNKQELSQMFDLRMLMMGEATNHPDRLIFWYLLS